MCSDEDNRDLNIGLSEFPLQVESTQAGKPHVQYEAAGRVGTLAGQKLLGSAKRLDLQAYGPQQIRQCFPDRNIVVHDENNRMFLAHEEVARNCAHLRISC